jgi:GT2 family glycosyltransferase
MITEIIVARSRAHGRKHYFPSLRDNTCCRWPTAGRDEAGVEPAGMTEPELSVVICTRNRAEQLAELLDALARQPDGERMEVIVVDNASADDTPRVVARLAHELALVVRYLHEPRIGSAVARNAGLQAASADVICFLDDDVEPAEGWSAAVLGAFADGDVACAGGPVINRIPAPMLGASDIPGSALPGLLRGYGDREGAPRGSPWGANLIVRSRLARELGGFRQDLGWPGTALAYCEDTDFCARVRAVGHDVHHVPGAIVYHKLSRSALTRAYWRSRAFEAGAARWHLKRGLPRTALGRALAVMRCAGELSCYGVMMLVAAGVPGRRFLLELRVRDRAGAIMFLLRPVTARQLP